MSSPTATGLRVVPVRLPVPAVLSATVLLATLVHAALALRSPSPWIVPDELIYSELARSIGDGELPGIRGETSFAWGLGYPVLLAPIWAAFDDATTAYAVTKCLNALVMSLTAVPTYFLARRFVTQGYALIAAALSVSVPSMLFAGTLMTEVALYPVVVLTALGIVAALERPTVGTQFAALGAIAFACTIKTLAFVLVAAYVAAIVLFHWLDSPSLREWRARLRRYAPTWVVLAAVALLSGAIVQASGRQLQDMLGTYSSVIDHMDLGAVPQWVLLHIAEFDLSLAVIPFAATLVVAMRGLRRRAERCERLFASLVVPVFTAWLVAVGAFASVPFLDLFKYPENIQRLQERSVFMLGPLFFVGLVLWLRDRPKLPVGVVAAILVAAALPASIPLEALEVNVRFQALALVPWVELRETAAWPLGVLLFAFTLGLILVLAIRVQAPVAVVLAPIVFVFLAVGLTAQQSRREAYEWTRSIAWGTAPDWVDAAVGRDANVSVLWAEPPGRPFVELQSRHYAIFVGEFFNRSIGHVYELGSPMPYALPTTPVRLDEDRVVLEDGAPAPLGELVLAPCYVHVVGTPVARDSSTGVVVHRVRSPVRARVASPGACP